jgi:hypothetical protein
VSPLWRNRLVAFVGPEHVSVLKLGRGLKPKLLCSRDEAVAPSAKQPAWQDALARLETILGEPEWQAPEAEVVLSSRFVRYIVASFNDQLKKYTEQEAYARHVMSQLHGAAAMQGEVRIQKSRGGKPVLACAVDQTLLGEIRRVCETHGLGLRAVSPDLTAVFNRFGNAFKDEQAWLIIREPGYSLFALYDKGAFAAINGVSHASLTELPTLLDRENLVSGLAEPCRKVYVYSHAHEIWEGVSSGGYDLNRLESPPSSGDEPGAGGVAFADGWRNALKIDYQRVANQPRRAAGWMLLMAGLVIVGEMAVSYARLHHEREAMLGEMRASGLHVDLSSEMSSGRKFGDKDVAAAHDIMSRLSAPWEDFFASIESIKNDDVAILSMDPDTQAGALTIAGEAKDYAAVLTLIAQLRRKREFADVFLQRHDVKADDPQHPVSFSIFMRWVTP